MAVNSADKIYSNMRVSVCVGGGGGGGGGIGSPLPLTVAVATERIYATIHKINWNRFLPIPKPGIGQWENTLHTL